MRGIGALAVVMVLLFIMMLVAAYANRSLMLEQRISGNQYRAAQAFEAAEAGVEWALAQLNAGRVDGSCQATSDATAPVFSKLVLGEPDVATGTYPHENKLSTGALRPMPACVRLDTGWSCYCPGPSLAALKGASETEFPLFLLGLQASRVPGTSTVDIRNRYPKTIDIKSFGCNRVFTFTRRSTGVEDWGCDGGLASESFRAHAAVQARAMLQPALVNVPSALLTVRGTADLGSTTLLRPPSATSVGPVVQSGGAISAGSATLVGTPGTPVRALLVEDPQLSTPSTSLSDDQFFATFFGLPPASYALLPAVRLVTCTGAAECRTRIQAAVAKGGSLLLVKPPTPDPSWVLELNELTAPLGTAEQPVVLVVQGPAQLGDNVKLQGFLYAQRLTWTGVTTGNAWLKGALASPGNVSLGGPLLLSFDADTLTKLNLVIGTWLRVPGSWRG